MTGKCIEFDINKGYGRIADDNNQTYFCHFSSIQSDVIHLDVDTKVSFDVKEGRRGPEAVMVKLI